MGANVVGDSDVVEGRGVVKFKEKSSKSSSSSSSTLIKEAEACDRS